MKLFSPAKINLYLKVVRRRRDGFHDLVTVFERISLGDDITLKPAASGISLKTDSRKVPSGPENLVWRAAALLKLRCRVKTGVSIRLKKRIPVAAGLGGGSSNAASVLLGLNRLWKLRLSKKKLLAFGAELGSDVPFFLLDVPRALGRGRGEVLRPLAGKSRKIWHCLVKPPFGISTKQAYSGLKPAALTPPGSDVKMLVRSIQKGDFGRFSGLLTNSLEVSLNKRLKTVSKIKKELLRQGAIASLMSGSGSTVFGVFRTEREAGRAARAIERKNKAWQVFVASTY